MSNTERTTYVGVIKNINDFYDFFLEYKLIDGKIEKIDEMDKLNYTNPEEKYTCINFRKREKQELFNKYNYMLPMYKDQVCCVTYDNDDFIKEDNRIFISFCDLMEEKRIEIIDFEKHGFYKVVTTSQVLKENWNDNNWDDAKTKHITPDTEVDKDKKYFLEHYDSFVGPLETVSAKGRNWLLVPKDEELKIVNEVFCFGENNEKKYVYLPKGNGGGTGRGVGPDPIEEKRKELISGIENYRKYDKDMIRNILICITQGFLTVFAGEPGTGKTSLCDILAKVLGLDNEKNKRYLSISVERGWTSKNDLIGYYNPLNGGFVDNTGLYKALKTVSSEEEAENVVPYLVLLDEANLSQMEYYWSSFIKLADDDARKKEKLKIIPEIVSEDKKNVLENDGFNIPDWFKFIATINNDQTTESLSPRLLDRAWVITLPEEKNSTKEPNNSEPLKISWKDIQGWFGSGVSEPDANEFAEAKKALETIYKIYKNHDKPVSQRSKNAIEAYLKAALSCFEEENKIDQAIDFILMQRLLPMLNGYISQKFIEELKKNVFNDERYAKSHDKFIKMTKQEKATVEYVSFFM